MKFLIALFLLPHSVFAAFSNYNSILIGDQVAGMGGAGTAIVGDVAASPYYNPATLGMLEASAFSAAVGVYKKFDTIYEEEEDVTKAPMRVSQGYFRSLPSSVGSAIQIRDWVFGLSIIVPDYDNFKGDLYNKGQNVTSLSYTDESLWAGVGVGKRISEAEALGATLYYTARNYSRSVNDRSFTGTTEATIFNSERTKQDNTLVAIFGYYRRLSDAWGMGVSLRPRSFLISSKLSVFENTTVVDTAGPTLTQTTLNKPGQDSDAIVPGKAAVGFTFAPEETWLFSGDIAFHEEISYQESSLNSISVEVNHRPIWNFQVGVQKALREWLKIRTGVFTDFSAHPDPATTSKLQQDHVDMYGFSANFDFIAGSKIGYTFGGYYTGGKGLSRQRINHRYDTIAKTQHIFTMLLGTSFYF